MNRETPTFIGAQHSATSYGLGNLTSGQAVVGTTTALRKEIAAGMQPYNDQTPGQVTWGNLKPDNKFDAMARAAQAMADHQRQQPKKETQVTRRLVQVFIADPNENIPLEDSLLYRGDQKLTDSTDQELFFEVDIKTLLDAHNAKRIKIVNKAVKDRTEYLEPARIRDLKMVVVTIAQF